MSWLRRMSLLLALSGLGACVPREPERDEPDEEEQLAARCDAWRSAYCSSFAPCLAVTQSDCRQSVEEVVCLEDAPLDDCVAELSASTCASLPTGCHPLDVADTLEVYRRCEDLKGAYCLRLNECDSTVERAACRREQDAQLDCRSAYAVEGERYDDCVEAIAEMPCGTTELPPNCARVIWIE